SFLHRASIGYCRRVGTLKERQQSWHRESFLDRYSRAPFGFCGTWRSPRPATSCPSRILLGSTIPNIAPEVCAGRWTRSQSESDVAAVRGRRSSGGSSPSFGNEFLLPFCYPIGRHATEHAGTATRLRTSIMPENIDLMGRDRTNRDGQNRIRKPLLYPTELRDQKENFSVGSSGYSFPFAERCLV